MKDIEDVRNDFVRYQKHTNDKTLEDTVVNKFNRLTSDFKKEKPFFYYIAAPFLCAKKMILHSGSYYMPVYKNSPCYSIFQMFLKISQSALYYLLLIFGW